MIFVCPKNENKSYKIQESQFNSRGHGSQVENEREERLKKLDAQYSKKKLITKKKVLF